MDRLDASKSSQLQSTSFTYISQLKKLNMASEADGRVNAEPLALTSSQRSYTYTWQL